MNHKYSNSNAVYTSQIISLNFPGLLVFGDNCFNDFIQYFSGMRLKRVFIIADPNVSNALTRLTLALNNSGIHYVINKDILREPSLSEFNTIVKFAELSEIDSVIGIGGGSVLDVAKLTAALCYSGIKVDSVFGKGLVSHRKLFLACIPTTSGTGSEVSPNSILLDEKDNLKKAVVSPFLIPDATYVDPVLTYSVPPHITASTGIDALTHCIEAYANKFAHPVTDMIALEGIRLIYNSLEKACLNGFDAHARLEISMGSMYGGMCLGPVNTAAVHALAYPLGSEFHIPHGVSNAILLPHVLEYNLTHGTQRYANIARAIGAKEGESQIKTAKEGVKMITRLCRNIGIPAKLSDLHVPVGAIPSIAKSAMSVQRLLRNNLRELTESDIRKIYYKLF